MSHRFAILISLTVLTSASDSFAEAVSFDIDETQSSLSLSGAVRYYFNGSVFGFAEQSAGSLTTAYDGFISGDLIGDSLSLTGGSLITALANPSGPFAPAGPGTVDAYGMQTFSAGGGQAFNRMYDISLDLTSGSATHGTAFAGNIAYAGSSGGIFPFFDAAPINLAGVTAANTALGNVSIISDGTTQILTIPIDVNLIYFGNGTGVETRLTGLIIATRAVPTPGTLPLLALAGIIGPRRRRG